jgi:hypothetical protein
MNRLLKLVFLLCLTCLCRVPLFSQNPFRPPSFPGHPREVTRYFLLENLDRPSLVKIPERYMMHAWVGSDSVNVAVHARVKRIRGDSIYLDSIRIRFHELESFTLPGYKQYRRADSLKWRVFFPPENVYHDHWAHSSYLREIHKQVKKDKIAGKSCMSFHNFLKFNVTKLANLEIAFDYEHRFTQQLTVEGEIGIQFAGGDPMADDFFMGSYPLWKYSGVNLLAGPKYYLGQVSYLQFVAIYHYLNMDLSRTKSGNGGDYGLQYQYRNDIGGALRFGFQTKLGNTGVLDAYIGGGVKLSYIDQFIYGYYGYDDSLNDFFWYNADHSADHNHVTQLWPVINAGIKIGVGF